MSTSSPIKRAALLATGFVSLGLGIAGVFLPVLPTTCFVLLAAACFARSSPRFEKMLLDNRAFGPVIRSWRRDRTMPPRAKLLAVGSIVFSIGLSVILVDVLWVRLMLLGIGAVLVTWISCVRTRSTEGRRAEDQVAVKVIAQHR